MRFKRWFFEKFILPELRSWLIRIFIGYVVRIQTNTIYRSCTGSLIYDDKELLMGIESAIRATIKAVTKESMSKKPDGYNGPYA
jgi:hypothetical protein